MSATVEHAGRDETTLDLTPEVTLIARHRMAVRDLKETVGLRRLCWTLALLDIRLRYRGSMLGPFWLTLSTAVMVGSMSVVYAALFRMDLHEYLPFLALSMVLWAFMGQLVAEGATAFTAAEGTVRSMRMPFSLYAAQAVVRNLLVLGHNVVVIIAVYVFLDIWPGATAFLALPGLALWIVDGFAVCLLLGTICARFRDIPPIVNSVMQMAFFISAVIWKPSQLGRHEWLLAFNPFFTLLEVVRAPLLGSVPSLAVWASALLSSVVLWAASWMLFARVRGRIAFWI